VEFPCSHYLVPANGPDEAPQQGETSFTTGASSFSGLSGELNQLEATKLRRCFPHYMRVRTSENDDELLLEADEIDNRAVRFVPLTPSARSPALLAGGFIGKGDVGDEKTLY
jgi:hypothetical protein